jgi:hypothetical protein
MVTMLTVITGGMYAAIKLLWPKTAVWQAALISSAVGLVPFILVLRNAVYSSRQKRADEFDKRWREMKDARLNAARHLYGVRSEDSDVEEVLNFFEDLGKSLKEGEVDCQDIYHRFDEFIRMYWECCFSQILDAQAKEGKDVWDHIYHLYETMRRISRGRPRTEVELRIFLKSEGRM